MKNRARGLVPAVVLAVFLTAGATGAGAESGSLIAGASPAKGGFDLGLIFDSNDILLGLGTYQGGVGAKIGWGNFSLRGLVGVTLNGSAQAFGANAGITAEYHLIPGPVSPYLGASFVGGYTTQSGVSSAETLSIGGLAGVEVFIFDFMSVFAEYTIEADLTNTTDLQTSQSTFDYLVGTKMGNNASIGVVIYFMRSGARSK